MQAQMAQQLASSGGQRKSRVDASQTPSVIAVQADDQETYNAIVYSTASQTVPPLCTTDCLVADEGTCHSIKSMRMS